MKASLLQLAIATLAVTPLRAAPADYIRDVKPLLAARCYACHGASQQKGGLRLDTAALALQGGDLGPAVKPGRAAESLLIQLVQGTHPDLARMPYKKPPLSDTQISLLEAWIDQGAKAPSDEAPESAKHWSFIAPVRPSVPTISNLNSRISNPIDAFILAHLERDRIPASPEADRVTLIRQRQ